MTSSFLLVASFPDSVLDFRGELVKEIQSCGYRVHLAVPNASAGSRLRSRLEDAGVIVHDIHLKRTATNPLADLRLLWNLYSLARRIRPDVVLSYTIKPVIYASLGSRLAKVPRIFALITGLGHTFSGTSSGFVAGIVHWLYRFSLRGVDKVIFQNPDDQRLFQSLGILPRHASSAVVNGSGVSLSKFDFQAVEKGAPQFLLIARLIGAKGIREYAAAARRVRQTRADVRFCLAGWSDGEADAISNDELDSWVESGDIDFLGRLDDVRSAIANSSVYVLPSAYREGVPRTVLEAMAMGRAIITTNAPGCRETVIDGENGFLVPVGSVSALVAAMRRFVDDPTLAENMGMRSREIAEEKFDATKVNAVMMREMGIS